jgi:hypothetical protein
VDCCGTTIYVSFGIGPQVINDCLQYNSLFATSATISFINYSVSSCTCITPTPTLTATPTPTPTPAPLIVANGTYTCSTGTNCDGEFAISSVSGGSGAPYQTSYVVSGNPPSWNNYPATNLYTGLCGGTNYVLSLKDSSGFIRTADPNTQCSVTPTPTPTATPTPSPTPTLPPGVNSFAGCGYGNSTASACDDASINNRTLYSNCNSGTFGVGCFVYVDTFPNALTGYSNVFMNSASWDINSSTGVVTAYSSEQC